MEQSAPLKSNPKQPAAGSVDEYVDDRELHKRTSLSRVYWQKLRAEEKGPPFYRVGRRCLYLWREVQTYLAANRVGGDK